MTTDTVQTGISDNAIGALAYVTLIPAIIFLAIAPYNKSSYVRFHCWQSIVLSVASMGISYAIGFFASMTGAMGPFLFLGLRGLVGFVFFLIWLLCVINALNGKRFKLPIAGNWAEAQSNK